MQNIEINLSVGQMVRVGDKRITILEIDGEEVFFQVEPDWHEDFLDLNNPPPSQPSPK